MISQVHQEWSLSTESEAVPVGYSNTSYNLQTLHTQKFKIKLYLVEYIYVLEA